MPRAGTTGPHGSGIYKVWRKPHTSFLPWWLISSVQGFLSLHILLTDTFCLSSFWENQLFLEWGDSSLWFGHEFFSHLLSTRSPWRCIFFLPFNCWPSVWLPKGDYCLDLVVLFKFSCDFQLKYEHLNHRIAAYPCSLRFLVYSNSDIKTGYDIGWWLILPYILNCQCTGGWEITFIHVPEV